jgi:hypothetical protein
MACDVQLLSSSDPCGPQPTQIGPSSPDVKQKGVLVQSPSVVHFMKQAGAATDGWRRSGWLLRDGGDDLDSRPVTEGIHPTYHIKWGLLRGAVLFSLAPGAHHVASRLSRPTLAAQGGDRERGGAHRAQW